MCLKIICCFTLFLIPAIHCNEEVWELEERVKNDEFMMEMENYAIYMPINELLLEVTKIQERCYKINEMIKIIKTILKSEENSERQFRKLWGNWYPVGTYDGTDIIDSKYVLCRSYFFKVEERSAIQNFYFYSLEKASEPLDNLYKYVNQTLEDITPQLKTMKTVVTISLKLCETKDLVCKENIKKWTLLEIRKYRSIMEKIKQKLQITSIMRMLQKVTDDIQKFKYEYFKILNEKKQSYLCCQQKIMLGTESACQIFQEQFDFPPIEFGKEIFSQEQSEETTTQMMQATTS